MIELHLVNNYLNDLSLKYLLGDYISSNSNILKRIIIEKNLNSIKYF